MITLSDDYRRLLANYVQSGDESALVGIAALASKAVLNHYPLEAVAELHANAVSILAETWQNSQPASERAVTCLSEFLMAFGMSFRELSERNQNLMAVKAHSQKLEALGQLAAGVAHEFNNLLQPITGLAELMAESDSESEMKEAFDTILGCGRKAAVIVRHILTYVRQMTPASDVIPFGESVAEETAFIRRSLSPTLQIKCRVPAEDGYILGDRGELAQVVHNLVKNAADALGGAGVISIEVDHLDDDRMCLTVRDDGIGMDEAVMARMFEPFFTTKRLGEGTGLGLAVVLGIITEWNGIVTVETVLGKGTTISVSVPKAVSSQMSARAV